MVKGIATVGILAIGILVVVAIWLPADPFNLLTIVKFIASIGIGIAGIVMAIEIDNGNIK